MPAAPSPKTGKASAVQATGECVCGAVRLEIDVPAFWAWHDHSAATRRAQGSAYATYVGTWRSRLRILQGSDCITRFEDAEAGTARSFCAGCGTPLLFEREPEGKMINLPRALFTDRTGREPRYHRHMGEMAEWIWTGEAVVPLKGYPGVMWERPGRKNRPEPDF